MTTIRKGSGRLTAMLLLMLFLVSGGRAQAQNEITLLAPGPVRAAVEKIVANFQAQTKYSVKVTYGSGRSTRELVAKGQTLDVSLIVEPFPGAIASGTIVPSSATPIASFLIAVVVPKGAPKPDISSAAAFKKALLGAKSIGYEDPDFSTAGEAPTEMLNRLGIAEQVAAKSVLCAGGVPYANNSPCFAAGKDGGAGVRGQDQWVASGDVAIAMMYLNAALPNKEKFDIVGVLPRKICAPTTMVGFVSARASNPEGAKALLQYLASAPAQAIFKEAGFEPHK